MVNNNISLALWKRIPGSNPSLRGLKTGMHARDKKKAQDGLKPSSGEASLTIWSCYANFKSFSLFISLEIACFHSL